MKKMILAGNWKMNTNIDEAINLAKSIADYSIGFSNVKTIICPPATNLYAVKQSLNTLSLKIGAQNCHFENSGAFTGENSPSVLKSIGCSYVILGHSERRQYFQETDELVNKKIKSCLSNNLKVILCVGETLQDRDKEITDQVVKKQLSLSLDKINELEMESIVIAYEPVWAIGTGRTPTLTQIEETHFAIRAYISEKYGSRVGLNCPILYGGSLNDTNAKEILSIKDVNGGLIGGASLKFDSFSKIIKIGAESIK